MGSREKIIVGLEVGTSKVCAVVGEVSAAGELRIIGLGQVRSEGVRKGEIVDMGKAVDNIHAAVVEAEYSADVEIHNVFASVTGGHLRCFNSRGSVIVANDDGVITENEVRNVLQNAKAVNIPVDHVVVHAIRQRFYVDGADGVQSPVGQLGAKLEADVHVIHGVRTRLQNTIRCIKQVPLDVQNIAVSSLASASAVLPADQQELGALVIDMGGGTTDYIVYREGLIQHTGCLAVGGEHITNDIAIGLRIPINRAEQLKLEHGSLTVPEPDEIIRYKREVGLPDQEHSRQHLCRIMRLRVEETLQLIRKDLERQRLLDYLAAGVFITGGCARLPGLGQLAEEVFGLPVHIGHSQTVNGPTATIESPELSTAIGLLRFGQNQPHDPRGGGTAFQQAQERFRQLIEKVRSLL